MGSLTELLIKERKSMDTKKRRILVTSALPYANGQIHLGHILEHVITDIWVRFQKMQGHDCIAICADDTHGTPIMIEAKKRGITPEELIAKAQEDHLRDLSGFLVNYDHYGSTHSKENQLVADEMYLKIREKGLIEDRSLEQFYCDHDKMFLPDRFVKGTCPKCSAQDQYGDSCESCSGVYSPADLKEPFCVLCKNKPRLAQSEHCFFKLSEAKDFLSQWIKDKVQEGVSKKLYDWIDEGLKDWCITRDAPYFGFELPDRKGKYYYVWFDATIGYVSSTLQWCKENNRSFEEFWKNPGTEIYHNIGKDIVYFHTLFWPAVLTYSGYQTPASVWIHGMLTVNGVKMSKSRGTFINAKDYLEHLPPEYLRYYLACKLSDTMTDVDLNLEDFSARVNADLVGKITNLGSRSAQMLGKSFDLRLKLPGDQELLDRWIIKGDEIAASYEQRQFSKAMLLIRDLADEANGYFDEHAPWKLIKENPEKTQGILSVALHLFRLMGIYLAPVLPEYSKKVAALFKETAYSWDRRHHKLDNQLIAPYEHLMQRLDPKALEKIVEQTKQQHTEPAPAASHEALAPEITIDDLVKVDLRVALVKAAHHVEGADKLLRLELNLGPLGERQIFAGIKSAYQPEDLIGKLIVVVANLKPRKMKFGLSEGMALAAGPGGKEIFLIHPHQGATPGMRLA